jgi:hypothetical protein
MYALHSIQGFSKNNELENSLMVHERSSHVHGLSNLTMREAMLISE